MLSFSNFFANIAFALGLYISALSFSKVLLFAADFWWFEI